MALRARYGGPDPMFLLSVGGFHPDFSPPPGMPKLQRLTVNFFKDDNPRLRLQCYFACTSSIIQFGVHLHFYIALAS